MLTLNLPNPSVTAFAKWAAILVEQIAGYNVPNPVSEAEWLQWATQVYAVPEMVEAGMSDPRAFADWTSWATNFMQVTT